MSSGVGLRGILEDSCWSMVSWFSPRRCLYAFLQPGSSIHDLPAEKLPMARPSQQESLILDILGKERAEEPGQLQMALKFMSELKQMLWHDQVWIFFLPAMGKNSIWWHQLFFPLQDGPLSMTWCYCVFPKHLRPKRNKSRINRKIGGEHKLYSL